MKKNYTHVTVLLDKSSSMDSIKGSVISGVNEFLDTQKKVDGEMTFSQAQFSDRDKYDLTHDMVPIKKVKSLTTRTFSPNGMTALHDSLGKLIINTGTNLAALDEADRPEKVLFMIVTDGGENDSREFTAEKIKEMIEHQEQKYNWQFMYIGANQDSIAVASGLGIKGAANFTANSVGTMGLFRAAGASLASYRSADVGTSYSLNQDDIDNASK